MFYTLVHWHSPAAHPGQPTDELKILAHIVRGCASSMR